jgi:hypothetical protein
LVLFDFRLIQGSKMSQELLSASVAAEVLAEILPDRNPAQWELWLRNNRNQARKAVYRIPVQRISNGAFYTRDELAKFAEWEKGRRLGKVTVTGRAAEVMRAFGIGEASGGAHGRRLSCSVNVQPGEAGTAPYVQLIVNDPLLVFRLDADDLADLIKELTEAKACVDRLAGSV